MITLGSEEITGLYLGDSEISSVYLGDDIIYSSGPKIDNYITFTAHEADSHIGLREISPYHQLWYSRNAVSWKIMNIDTNITLSNVGDCVYIAGVLDEPQSIFSNYTQFLIEGGVSVGGNCNSVWNCYDVTAPLKAYCGAHMFSECTGLIDASTLELPTDVLAEWCYAFMFADCTRLVSAPALTSTTLSNGCYMYMFAGCTSLAEAPGLPATELTDSCYQSMFAGCSSLETTPILSASTLAESCCSAMFNACTSLTSIQMPPATRMARDCYALMFKNCTGLVHVSSNLLPSEDLDELCYRSMFDGCSNLKNIPELPANILKNQCYRQMFSGCTSLENLSATTIGSSATTSASGCCDNMFAYCTNLTYPPQLPALDAGDNCYQSMFIGCTSLVSAPELPATTINKYCYYMMFSGCTSLETAPSELPASVLQESCYNRMFASCTSLTSSPALLATGLSSSCYAGMFSGCTNLVSGPEVLPAIEASVSCYNSMFYNCSSLINAPVLCATTLSNSCYTSMFRGCVNLEVAPTLVAQYLPNYCYNDMFNGCSKLSAITACFTSKSTAQLTTSNWLKDVSSAGLFKCHLTLQLQRGASGIPENWDVERFGGPSNLYFESSGEASVIGLSKLNSAQRIWYTKDDVNWSWEPMSISSNIQLEDGEKLYVVGDVRGGDQTNSTFTINGNVSVHGNLNYLWNTYGDNNIQVKMFAGNSLFSNCTGLTDASDLSLGTSATTLNYNCYTSMFNGCINLVSGPEILPANTLFDRCYKGMFSGCSNLISAPELPATTLEIECYRNMFSNCASLSYIKCLATDISANNCTDNWVSGVASTGTFIKHSDMIDWPTGNNGIPSNWTVQDAAI